MENTIKQVVIQNDKEGIEKRFVIQYSNVDLEGNMIQKIINYDTLSDNDKQIFNSFIDMCLSKNQILW